MTNAHMPGISHCDEAPGRTVQGARIYAGPLFPYFQPMVSGVLAFSSVEGEHMAEKSHMPYRAAWGTERCAKEKHPLYGYLLVTSFLPTKPQLLRIPHQCHWLVIKPLWVNVGAGFLSNPQQAKGPTG